MVDESHSPILYHQRIRCGVSDHVLTERKLLMAGSLPWLKTDGNKIVTEDGQEVILRGANIMRAEHDQDNKLN
jgi:hypothetical protein